MQSYSTASRSLLAQAFEELSAGDARQASEKGWGAAAQIVKAVAHGRGLPHQSHGLLFEIIDVLARETGDDDIRRCFQVASSLHVNFYENWDTPHNVEAGLRDVERLLVKLGPLTQ